jgi:hypothetical protein
MAMSSYIALQRVVLCPPSAFPPEKQDELGKAPTVADVWLLCSGAVAGGGGMPPPIVETRRKIVNFVGNCQRCRRGREIYCPCPPPKKKHGTRGATATVEGVVGFRRKTKENKVTSL